MVVFESLVTIAAMGYLGSSIVRANHQSAQLVKVIKEEVKTQAQDIAVQSNQITAVRDSRQSYRAETTSRFRDAAKKMEEHIESKEVVIKEMTSRLSKQEQEIQALKKRVDELCSINKTLLPK